MVVHPPLVRRILSTQGIRRFRLNDRDDPLGRILERDHGVSVLLSRWTGTIE
jgi:hypothetical protein